jgi:hypothetical protein
MQHFIKTIGISLSLFFCAGTLMAQIPKIPKVPKVNIGKGDKAKNTRDAQKNQTTKTTTNTTNTKTEPTKEPNNTNSACESALKGLRNQLAEIKQKTEAGQSGNNVAGAYSMANTYLNRLKDANCPDYATGKSEYEKVEKEAEDYKTKKQQVSNQIYKADAAYTETLRKLQQSRDALNRLNVADELAVLVQNASYKPLKDDATKYGLESNYRRADEEYTKLLTFFSGEDKYLRQELDAAYANLKSQKSSTGWLLEKFTILSRYCDIALAINPNSTIHKDAKAEALKYKEMTLQKMRDTGVFSSKFHEENVYKVLFSDKPFVAGKESQNTIKTKFSLNDKIYGIAYFDERESKPLLLTFDLGSDKYIKNETHQQDAGGQGYYAFEVIPDAATGWTKLGYYITRDLAALTPRQYKINVSINKAVGTLELDATTGQEHVEKVNKAIYEKRVDMNRMQKPVSNDATAIDQATKLLSSAAGPDQKLQVQRVVVLNKNWTTYYDPNYIVKTISRRAIDVEIAYKDLKTGKCYCHATVISQNHNTKTFTNYEMSVRPNMENEIRCENINK